MHGVVWLTGLTSFQQGPTLVLICGCDAIDHFTVVGKVTWPLTGSEAGVDLVLIQISLLLLCKSSCSHAN